MRPAFPCRRPPRRSALLAALIAGLVAAPGPVLHAQEADPGEVTRDMQHKSWLLDVPFVPSHENVLKAMFEMAKPTPDDFVIDLGSGDGRIVIAAARDHGARGFGVDLNEGLVSVARHRAQQAGVADRTEFHVRDLFDTDIRPATILTMYLLPDIILELKPRLLAELRPGTRVVAHDYHMADWRPDDMRMVSTGSRGQQSIVYFWRVPAEVAGEWEWDLVHTPHLGRYQSFYRATLSQRYQDVAGSAMVNYAPAGVHDTRLEGRHLRFSITAALEERQVRHDFEGIVEGDRISGTVRLSGGLPETTMPWTASRLRAAD